MKKFLFSLVMVALVAFSCKKEEDPKLELSKQGAIEVVSGASEQSITVTTNQKTWKATCNADWVAVSQEGNILKLNIKENTSSEARKAEVSITASSLNKTITINQAGLNITLDVNPKLIEATSEAGSYSVEVKTNFKDWTFSSNADWAIATKSENTLKIEVKENTTTTERNAEITIKAGKEQAVVSVKQALAVSIELNPTSLEVEGAAGNYTFEVISNVAWDVECAESWAKVKKQDNKTVAITVEENNPDAARTAKILVKYNNGKSNKEFTLTQKPFVSYTNMFPLLDVDATFDEIDAFEKGRGSSYKEDEKGYSQKNENFDFIRYTLGGSKNKVIKIEHYTTTGNELIPSGEFAKILKAVGFKSTNDPVIFTKEISSKDGSIYDLEAKLFPNLTAPAVLYNFKPREQVSNETFATIPFGYNDFNGNKEALFAWEAEHGGVEVPTGGFPGWDTFWFDVNDGSGVAARLYVFINNVFSEAVVLISDVKKVYRDGDGVNVSDEFAALLEREGFVLQSSSDWKRYVNINTDRTISFTPSEAYNFLNDGKFVVDLRYFPNGPTSSSLNLSSLKFLNASLNHPTLR